MKEIFLLIISYLIGTISGAYFIGNKMFKIDIRKYGSGNAGSTNALRVMGKKFGMITFLIDFFKGSIVAILAMHVFKVGDFFTVLAILFAVIGHDYPFYMSFKGGKGVATTAGAFAFFNVKYTFIAILVWFIVVFLTRMVSAASISFFVVNILIYLICGKYGLNVNLVIVILMTLGIIRHKANIKRILNGNENKIGGKK